MNPNSRVTVRLRSIVLLAALSLALVPRESAAQQPAGTTPAPPRFIAIEQAGTIVPETDGEVRLARAPFTIVLALPTATTVLARVSRNSRVFDLARSGQSLIVPFGEGGGFVEGLRNGDESVFLVDSESEPGYHFWYYRSRTDHRFDSVEERPGGIIGRRTVSLYKAKGESLSPLAMLPASELYFVFRLVDARNVALGQTAIKVTFAGERTERSGVLGPEAVATVGARVITAGAFKHAYQVAIKNSESKFGPLKNEQLRALGVHVQALQQLVDDEVMILEAERLGITVTDAQVMGTIMSIPMFQSGGKFVGEKRYIEILHSQRPALTHDQFMDAVRLTMTQQALIERVRPRAGTEAEKASAYRAYLDKGRANLRVVVSPEAISRAIADAR